jgi:mitogen-activated protein kinase kinase kinase 5
MAASKQKLATEAELVVAGETTSSGSTHTTDSIGSRSSERTTVAGGGSGATGSGLAHSGPSTTSLHKQLPRMEVVCVIDLHFSKYLSERKSAFEEVRLMCSAMGNHNVTHIQFEKLDFGETNVLDSFYNADVAIIDLSVQVC